jgi:hypothetical protein
MSLKGRLMAGKKQQSADQALECNVSCVSKNIDREITRLRPAPPIPRMRSQRAGNHQGGR